MGALRSLGACTALFGLAAAAEIRAEEAVSPKVALAAMVKMLAYDRTLTAKGGGDFVVAVPFEPGQEGDKDALIQAAADLTFHRRPVRVMALDVKAGALKGELSKQAVGALVLLRGTSAAALEAAQHAAEPANLYVLALDPALVEAGRAAMAVAMQKGRPQIALSLRATKRLNASFEPAALKMAKLYP